MKRFLLSILCLLVLSGCSDGGDVVEVTPVNTHYYATKDFRILIPDEWEIIEPNRFTSQTPVNTLIAFRNNVRNENFTANVVIITNALQQTISTTDYSRLLLQKLKTELIGYTELQVENIPITIGAGLENTLFSFIEGREGSNSDVKRFMQSSGVKEKNAYIAIGSFLSDDLEATAQTIEKMIRSFEIK